MCPVLLELPPLAFYNLHVMWNTHKKECYLYDDKQKKGEDKWDTLMKIL